MLLLKRTSLIRGTSLAEMLVSFGVIGLAAGLVALMFGPIVSAPAKHQAKIDTIHAAVRALYLLQRDIRISSKSGVYICNNNASTPGCTPATTTLTSAAVIAVLTPRSGGTSAVQFSPASGQPEWAGYNVYWVDSNNRLQFAFGVVNPLAQGADASQTTISANTAVTEALSGTSTQIAENISGMQVSANPTLRTVGLKLIATATENGKQNTASVESDTVARN